MSPFSRRGFFLTGLGGLVAGLLGRSEAKAAPPVAAVPKPPVPEAGTGGTLYWTVNAGSEPVLTYVADLPAGLSLDSSTGVSSGPVAGDSTISVNVQKPTPP